jgi:hypothetical protein
MCPKLKQSVCEVVGLEPEHVECTDKRRCFSGKWEWCKLYMVELLLSCYEDLQLSSLRKEVA